ncbi:MAG TPA: glycosyltransferase family 4 protein [Candidatus Elarobacter sp.]|nr:glycosyltransferase family 4 protein [Candidatus Elarobacter sp.]
MTTTVVIVGGTDPFVRVGGHETFVRAHAEAAVRAGFDTHVFYVTAADAPTRTEGWTAHAVRSPVRPLRTIMACAHAPFLSRAIERFLACTSGPVVLHAFSDWACVAARVTRWLERRGRRVVPVASAYTTLTHEVRSKLASVRAHHGAGARLRALIEYCWVRAVAARAERAGYEAMALVLVNYDSVERLLREEHALTVPIRRVPYAPLTAFADDAGAARPRALPPGAMPALQPAGAPLIVAVSRQDPRKGIDRLLRALALLHADGVPFRACLVGGGPLLATHRALSARLGLERCTWLPGWVGDAFPYLRAADIFVLPSLEEGSGSVSLLEAMQAGCAIVATRIDGIPEDVTDGVDGLLVAPDDPRALRDALARLLADGALRARLGGAARATFQRRFSAETLVATMRALYGEVAR